MNIFNYFRKKGIDTVDASFYRKIDEWISWYNSNVRQFTFYKVYTGQNDDQIILGECQIAIERPADLKAVFRKHCKVTSWSDNRFGTTPHWRIGGE